MENNERNDRSYGFRLGSLRLTVNLGDWDGPARLRENLEPLAGLMSDIGARIRKVWPLSLDVTLFWLAILIYAGIRLVGLPQYPIYFFTDEAIQTNLAADFIRDNLRNVQGELFPTYFRVHNTWNLNVSVYLQTLPYLFFGKSVFWTRATVALTSILAAYWVGRTLKDVFKVRYWWSGVLVLSIVPVWFMHSRTAFETPLMAVFFVGFLYYYMLYRQGDLNKVYPATVLGCLAFYTYSAGKIVIPILGLLLLISDLKYHWAQRKTLLKALPLLILFILPLVRFQLAHPEAQQEQLSNLTSYMLYPVPVSEKIAQLIKNLNIALGPGYWFTRNNLDLVRHQMGPIPHLFGWMLPFYAIGLGLCIANFKRSEYRTLLFALVAAPVGAALVSLGVTRMLAFVGPAAILVTFGIAATSNWVTERVPRFPGALVAIGLFAVLAWGNVKLLERALTEGPTWSEDYGLGGMQYGGIQVFGRIRELAAELPEKDIFVSPDWSNGTGELGGFFFEVPWPFRFGDPFTLIDDPNAAVENTIFIVLPDEYELILASQKVKDIQLWETLLYPNGEPGFYILVLKHSGTVAELVQMDIDLRQTPIEEEVEVNGEVWTVRHTPTDMGQLSDLFDNNPDTVARTAGGNPFLIEIFFPDARTLSGVELITGSHNAEIIVQVFLPGEAEPQSYLLAHQGSISDPIAVVEFETPVETDHILISVRDVGLGEPANIHIWQVEFITP